MSKGKFEQTLLYDDKGNRIVDAGVEKKELTALVESSYFFGQFMAYFTVIRLVEEMGYDTVKNFMKKKLKEISIGNPGFLTQAEKLCENVKQYYRDSMEDNNIFIDPKGKFH